MLISVAVPAPVRTAYTYRVPDALPAAAEPGRRVRVSFGRRKVAGVVLGEASGPAPARVLDVEAVLDDGPLFTPELLGLVRWAADYYHYPLGIALRAALPPGMDEPSAWALTLAGREALDDPDLDPDQTALLAALAGGEKLAARDAKRLVDRGLVQRSSDAGGPRAAAAVLMVSPAPGASVEKLRRAPARAAVLSWLLARGEVPLEEVRAAFPRAAAQVRELADAGLCLLRDAAPAAVVLPGERDFTAAVPAALTDAQRAAGDALAAALDQRRFAPFLLRGVTGSGKTEVYLRLIAEARRRGRGALVLVPEIALTPQLVGRFRSRFGSEVAVLHSGLTERERLGEWRRIHAGTAPVAVGVRSAVFAPVVDLAVIVVDEEHEPSFKQEDRLRYHARDLAVVRASRAGAVVVLGSATPSMETLHNAQRGRYTLLELPSRVDGRALPAVRCVDLRAHRKREAAEGDEVSLLTPELASALAETLERGEQSILFLNRRGAATFVLCRACGAAVSCPRCAVALTEHRRERALCCHYCDERSEVPSVCPTCGDGPVALLGAGTEKVELEVRARFPGARIARLDRDAAAGRGQAAQILAAFARRELDILVGTQMVAKGHDFPGVTLVGVLCADLALHQPDFRAAERTFQLLAQVAGRAGRGQAPGRIVVQAFDVEAAPVVAARTHDYLGFAAAEIEARAALGYPPFGHLAALRIEAPQAGPAEQAARRVAALARRVAGKAVQVRGPAPAPLVRLRGLWRWQVLLRAGDRAALAGALRALVEAVAQIRTARVVVDVDPVSML